MATHCNGNDDGNDGNELQRWNFLATMEFFGNALQRWKRFATCKQWIVARANTPLLKGLYFLSRHLHAKRTESE